MFTVCSELCKSFFMPFIFPFASWADIDIKRCNLIPFYHLEIFKELQIAANNNCTTISAVARDLILEGLANKNTNEHIFSSDTEWANAVKNRDGHKCVKCGSSKRYTSPSHQAY